ncbi:MULTISPECIES: LysR family transcriptional regulator [unclassified Lysobacter]|uniref:LysR family transcriptional regulator n=1 Tax=unclassified Lysobacter TaxID=2635362 RepID=UPI001BE6F842|nr:MULTISPECIES: LysR family transcriptional regulator [unclassified Lysobacter]MBT2750062.1 LysR family transcriptional regulator [Lysobacter sp. ISL-50]MBT2775366.1 LysR family transcriptional regulator [Lysobacter sp. ISL-54]MBT2783489.1 LysR family transcriptional regulator [Lysobacter sp. ISL-52]
MSKAALQDLNDLYYFAAVAEHGGFSAAGRALGVPKSKLSLRILQLEKRLGVLLFQRTTRKIQLTEVGARFLEHCRGMVAEAQAAQDAVDASSSGPAGLVRVSCPAGAAEIYLTPWLSQFMARYPRVNIQLRASDRAMDLVAEGIDIAVRLRPESRMDPELVTRRFGTSRRILVASPAYLESRAPIASPDELKHADTISLIEDAPRQRWELIGPGAEVRIIELEPRLMTSVWSLAIQAARDGQGIALLSALGCRAALECGELRRVLPDWAAGELVAHAVFPTRRGMVPAVRALLDFLADKLPQMTELDK